MLKKITYLNSQIAYYKIGSGNTLAIAFHGYGESGSHYEYLSETAVQHDTTIIAIDLPFHGNTEWKEGLHCTTNDIHQIISLILKYESFSPGKKYEIWGYSMGGRIALGYYQSYPQRIQRIVLIATDGIYVNPWYWLSTQTKIGNKIFHFTMHNPSWFLSLLKGGYKLKLINKSIYKFATTYVDDAKVRSDLYIRWTCFRKIHPSKHIITEHIHQHQTPILGIYGEFDRIIPFRRVERFWKGLIPHRKLIHLKDGHKLLQLKYAHYLWKD